MCYHEKLKKKLSGIIPISRDDFDLIKKQFRFRTFPQKKELLIVGDYWSSLYFINRGIIRLYYVSEDGRQFNKGFFFEGMFLWPIVPASRNNPSSFTIETMEPCETLVCNVYKYQEILERLSYWTQFSLYYAEWLAEIKLGREADFLLLSAQERYLRFIKSYKKIINRIPDYHIASYLGITNVSLSRIKKEPYREVAHLSYTSPDQSRSASTRRYLRLR